MAERRSRQDDDALTEAMTTAATGATDGRSASMFSAAAASVGSGPLQRIIARRAARRGGDEGAGAGAAAAVEAASHDSGAPVDGGIAGKVSAATGANLDGVRVHTGDASGQAAASVQAHAYTTGQDIHFGAGQYQPGTREGDRLIAHELVHTVQQRGGAGAAMQHKLEVSQPGDSLEREADSIADRIVDGGGASSAGVSAVGDGAVQRKEAAGPEKKDDPFKVDQGQLTFDAEGTEGGKYHTRKAHWPGGASGVTIGRGYDLGAHTKENIIDDMTSAGIPDGDAQKFAAAAGLKGTAAKDWLASNKDGLPEISPEQQEALFETTYAEHLKDVKRISGQYAKSKGKDTGKDPSELEINFDTVHPAIKDILVDLRYRGDYTRTSRHHVQPPAIANDLAGLATVMADPEKWKSVPKDRFERRKAYIEAAVKGGGGTQSLQENQPAKETATATTAGGGAGDKKPPVGTPSQGKPIGKVSTKTRVNVRKKGSKDSEILRTVDAGTEFAVTANVGSWYQIDASGGVAFMTTIPDYVQFKAEPAAEPPKNPQSVTPQGTGGDGGGASWLDQAWNAATHLVDTAVSWWGGDPQEQRQAEGVDPKAKDGGGAKTTTGTETTNNNTTTTEGGQEKQPEKQNTTKVESGNTTTQASPQGNLLFKEGFTVVDENSRLRDAKLKFTGQTIPKGTRVWVVKAERTNVQIITGADAAMKISEADNLWTAFSNLGGTGASVALGNENTDEADKEKADQLRGGLPPGRNPGKSPFKWQFSTCFMPSVEGKALEGTLMSKVHRLMEWAVQNDMLTSNIVIGDGMRGPKTAHKMCVAWNIQFRYGSVITLAALKALPGGKDADGTLWYQSGWSEEQIKANAQAIRASTAIAAAGYDPGEQTRAPLPITGKPGVSRHCTGRAVDVTIPWRAPGADASGGKTDVWAWEDIYKQFGLQRPLHKDLQSDPKLQENWHIEESGKKLEGDPEVEKTDD